MNDDELRRRLGELADRQPWVDDWTPGVRRRVARRRRQQAAVLAGATALVIAAGTGIGLAGTGPAGSQTLKVVSPPSGSPSPSAGEHSTPSATRSPTCSTSPAACASATPSPGTAPSTSPAAVPNTTPSPTPSATAAAVVNHVTVTVSISPAKPAVGQTATITVRAHGSAGYVLVDNVEFGDGTGSSATVSCAAQPATPAPAPRDDTRTLQHMWKRGGQFTVTAHASTPCSPYKGSSTGSQEVTVRAPVVNTFTVVVSESPAHPPIGLEATVTVRFHGSADGGFVKRVDFGDGTAFGQSVSCAASPPTPAPSPTDQVFQTHHVWTHTGTYTITAQVSGECSPFHGSGTGQTTVTVDPTM